MHSVIAMTYCPDLELETKKFFIAKNSMFYPIFIHRSPKKLKNNLKYKEIKSKKLLDLDNLIFPEIWIRWSIIWKQRFKLSSTTDIPQNLQDIVYHKQILMRGITILEIFKWFQLFNFSWHILLLFTRIS